MRDPFNSSVNSSVVSARAANSAERLPADIHRAIRRAGLRYVQPEREGIRRLRRGKGFRYADAEGKAVKDRKFLKRVEALAIPPAWDDVWIARDERAHLQATGRDIRGRKQYRYHAEWRATRDAAKFDRLPRFALTLPTLRERIERDLSVAGLSREKVLASAVKLLLDSHIRVGNECYVQENHSYGLTTLRRHHVDVDGARIEMHFVGKAGKYHNVVVHDRKVARVLAQCRQFSGSLLFRYIDESGMHGITSADVNAYLRSCCGREFSAKDVRTWAGTVLATTALSAAPEHIPRKRHLNVALRDVAEQLGNTLAICRKCYVHPGLLDMHLSGKLAKAIKLRINKPAIPGLSEEELKTLAVLSKL